MDGTQNTDLNNYTSTGFYGVNAEVTKSPFGSSSQRVAGTFIVYNAGETVSGHPMSQVFISYTNMVYYRSGWTMSWGSWMRVDNFGCNTLAELKAALANV